MDDDILHEFTIEAHEHLEDYESRILALEGQTTPDPDTVNKVFRAIHTIKGGASCLGLHALEEVSHLMEDLLSRVRDGKRWVTSPMAEVLLKAGDLLSAILDDPEQGAGMSEARKTVMQALERELDETAAPPTAAAPAAPAQAAVPERAALPVKERPKFAKLLETHADDFYFVTLNLPAARSAARRSALTLSKHLHSISKAVWVDVAKSVLDKTGRGAAHAYVISVLEPELLAGALGQPEENIARLGPGDLGSAGFDTPASAPATAPAPAATEAEIACKTEAPGAAAETAAPPEEPTDCEDEHAAEEPARRRDVATPEQSGKDSATQSETIRVNVDLLDKLMNLAGELVLGRNQLLQSQRSGDGAVVNVISQRVTELQETVMQTRMQPVGNVFGRFPRVVRDIARKMGKEIDLELTGKDVELDRSIIDCLADPLTHLIRNAADHGLESAAERAASGKPPAGKIWLRAYHESGQVVIEVQDDGHGIDPDAVKRKAIDKGLIAKHDAEKMTDTEAINLIFLPGFTTATVVTDLSGRGVGMDVVRTAFERLGGTVELQSEVGRGSKVIMRLPLTLAIVPSLVAAVSGDRFCVPQVNLVEIVRNKAGDLENRIERVKGMDVFRLRDKLLPVVSLRGVLGMKPDNRAETANGQSIVNVMVLRCGAHQFGLMVDKVVDTEEIVVKPLSTFIKSCSTFAGATIMGDGRVAMILDVNGIAAKAGLKFQEFDDIVAEEARTSRTNALHEKQSILIFNNAVHEHFAIPLSMVARLEKVDRSRVETVKDLQFVQLRGQSVPLLWLHEHLSVAPAKTDEPHLFIIVPKLIRRHVGIVATRVVDVVETHVEVDSEAVSQKGILGSAIINNRMTLMIDIYGLLETAGFHANESAKTASNRLLVAEDTPFFRTLIGNYFRSAGYEVTIANDGQQAWEILSEKPDAFDAVVSDIQMPKMDGYELVKLIKSDPAKRHLPVIALSALSKPAEIEKGMAAGFDEYEVKIDRGQLVKTVERLIARGPAVPPASGGPAVSTPRRSRALQPA